MLRVIDSLPDADVRKAFEKVLVQSEKLAGTAFAKVGVKGSPDEIEKRRASGLEFEKRVDEVRKGAKDMSRIEALQKARHLYPDEFKAYQEAGGNGSN
jgi:hypothetical protein